MRTRLGIALALTLMLPATAGAQSPAIQPGDVAVYPAMDITPGTGGCTLGWLFDGSDGGVYFSIASHCGQRGEEVQAGDGSSLGKVVMADPDFNAGPDRDVALIRVTPAMEPRVAGALRGHDDMPTGEISPTEAAPGDALQLSGWGIGFRENEQTREQRTGVFATGDEWSWAGLNPTINGDSGGPVAHLSTGRAFGLNKGHGCSLDGAMCGTQGPAIAAIHRLAEAGGIKLTLRLAGQPAPPKPAAPPAPAAQQEPPPSAQPAPTAKPAPAKKPSARAACRKKAKRIKSKRKRKAALKRCAKKR